MWKQTGSPDTVKTTAAAAAKLHPEIFQIIQLTWQSQVDLFADRTNNQLPTYCSWKPDPMAQVMDAFSVSMDNDESLCISSVLSNRESHSEMRGGEMRSNSRCTNMEEPSVVPSFVTSPCPETGALAIPSGSSDKSQRRISSAGSSEEVGTGGLEHIRGFRVDASLPPETAQIISNSLRNKSRKSYDSGWKAYGSWCSQRDINPIQRYIENVLTFITYLHRQGRAYNTIDLYRSDLSYRLPAVQWVLIP
jgi:hypothetical protein